MYRTHIRMISKNLFLSAHCDDHSVTHRHSVRAPWFAGLGFILLLGGCSASFETATVSSTRAPIVEDSAQVADALRAWRSSDEIAATNADRLVVPAFAGGRMWTFDNAPLDYLRSTYGVAFDSTWMEHARGAALRLPSCSASFITGEGLVITNHHCVREEVEKASSSDEDLLTHGYSAGDRASERKLVDFHADQLIEINDVTEQVYASVDAATTGDEQALARVRASEALARRLTTEAKLRDTTLVVEIVSLYNGGIYSAYTFKRHHDVRLVFAPEQAIGFFGGDADNFTYPRYNLDVALLRVYNEDGTVYQPSHFFAVDTTGVAPNEAVVVVGNPGGTSRLLTPRQLVYQRDFDLPQQIDILLRRDQVLRQFVQQADEDTTVSMRSALLNRQFSIANQLKALRGQLDGLVSDDVIAIKERQHDQVSDLLVGRDSLQGRFERVQNQLELVQITKQALAPNSRAFTYFASPIIDAPIISRGIYAYFYDFLRSRGEIVPPERLEEIREEIRSIPNVPSALEFQLLRQRFSEIRDALGTDDTTVDILFRDRSPDSLAAFLTLHSSLTDSTRTEELLDAGFSTSGDPSVSVISALFPLYANYEEQRSSLALREDNLNAEIGRIRLAVFGTSVPPDASFSLRLADGRVSGYTYNGTDAPPFTTFYGLYDRYYSHLDDADWTLPEQWIEKQGALSLSTPLNLVTTTDITGGNSGSPLLDLDLNLVGIIFDGNIESLPNEYVYRETHARAVSVDVRAVLEALSVIYELDHLVDEMKGQINK